MPDGRHHGEGQHDERDVAMPAMPGARFVVVEPQLVLRGCKAVLDGPAAALDLDQRLDAGARRAPGREEGQILIGDVAADQQAARPLACVCVRDIVFVGIEISQLAIDPVVLARTLRPVARR